MYIFQKHMSFCSQGWGSALGGRGRGLPWEGGGLLLERVGLEGERVSMEGVCIEGGGGSAWRGSAWRGLLGRGVCMQGAGPLEIRATLWSVRLLKQCNALFLLLNYSDDWNFKIVKFQRYTMGTLTIIFRFKVQWLIAEADSGFPLGGGRNIRFCQMFPKTAWNRKNYDVGGGGVRPSRLP